MSMKVFVAPGAGEAGKFRGVIQAFPDVWKGIILDVGCRSGNFKSQLPNKMVRYYGIDLFPPATIIANVEHGLPFKKASFDVVVALDVLEHTNDIHNAFGELCRVARGYVVISLPNGYELRSRLKFLLGHPISGKYLLPTEPLLDRHRWLFSLREAQAFTHTLSKQYGFKVEREGCLIGPRRGFVRLAVSFHPNLLSPWYIALLLKEGKINSRG
ncbi:MAG: class I SAM-dependent methyltransferase [Bacillota bacterium]